MTNTTTAQPKVWEFDADSHPVYEMRRPEELKDIPKEMINMEVQHVLPIAQALANAIGIDCIQEVQYGNTLPQIRERCAFVVLNVQRPTINHGMVDWFGLVVMCKKHPIVKVLWKGHLATGRCACARIDLWSKDERKYYMLGDPNQKHPIDKDDILPSLLTYLVDREHVLKLA